MKENFDVMVSDIICLIEQMENRISDLISTYAVFSPQ